MPAHLTLAMTPGSMTHMGFAALTTSSRFKRLRNSGESRAGVFPLLSDGSASPRATVGGEAFRIDIPATVAGESRQRVRVTALRARTKAGATDLAGRTGCPEFHCGGHRRAHVGTCMQGSAS